MPINGDLLSVISQLDRSLKPNDIICQAGSAWWKEIKRQESSNKSVSQGYLEDSSNPMNYYNSLARLQNAMVNLGDKFILVSEGSNTMNIGRTILMNTKARQRLDAGTFGTMGVGFGFAIAAQRLYPDHKVIMVEGDSGFGFSAMELETAARYGMPLKCVIINNSGVMFGTEVI